MNLRARLSERVHIENIREILHYIQDNERLREEIYRLIYDEDSIVSYQALWVCTHFSKPPGVQSLCIKLAYQLTRFIPELQQELRTMLEIMEPELLVPAIRSVRKNTLKAIKAKKN